MRDRYLSLFMGGLCFVLQQGVPDGQNRFAKPQTSATVCDLDHDGIADQLEQELAERYAPINLMAPDEPNLPIDVAVYLRCAELWFYDESCSPHAKRLRATLGGTIPPVVLNNCKSLVISSHGTWGYNKKHTFFIRNVDPQVTKGAENPAQWTTYFHAYRNDLHGITIQYWRFYAYDTAFFSDFHIGAASHGGDWEGIHVVLGPALKPAFVRLLGHKDMEVHNWSEVMTENGHPIIRVEKGGHASFLASNREVDNRGAFIEHESWSGGRVRRPLKSLGVVRGDPITHGGDLKNFGEKTAPMKGMEFILFSGLWGTREGGLLGYYRSGYWGPAFNNSSLRSNGFLAAWCDGISEPDKRAWRSDVGLIRECFPIATVP